MVFPKQLELVKLGSRDKPEAVLVSVHANGVQPDGCAMPVSVTPASEFDLWTAKRVERRSSRLRLLAFFRGMGSVLCLFPPKKRQTIIHASESDFEAICNDFATIGKDLERAMGLGLMVTPRSK